MLVVRHIVDHGVPGKAGVVDDDVDSVVGEFGGFLDQVLVVDWVDDLTYDDDGGAAGFVNESATNWALAVVKFVMMSYDLEG